MGGFLTGLAAAAAIFVATWAVLQPATITTVERNASSSVVLPQENPRGGSWQ